MKKGTLIGLLLLLGIVIISSVVLITYKDIIQGYMQVYLDNKLEEQDQKKQEQQAVESTNIAYNPNAETLTQVIEVSTNVKTTPGHKKHYVSASIALSASDDGLLETLNASTNYLLDIYTSFFNTITDDEITLMSMDDIKVKLQEEVEAKLQVKVNNIYITKYMIQ